MLEYRAVANIWFYYGTLVIKRCILPNEGKLAHILNALLTVLIRRPAALAAGRLIAYLLKTTTDSLKSAIETASRTRSF